MTWLKGPKLNQFSEVRFSSFFSGEFITTIVVNPPTRKLEKRTSVQWGEILSEGTGAHFQTFSNFLGFYVNYFFQFVFQLFLTFKVNFLW